jgi:hypothetical protein
MMLIMIVAPVIRNKLDECWETVELRNELHFDKMTFTKMEEKQLKNRSRPFIQITTILKSLRTTQY